MRPLVEQIFFFSEMLMDRYREPFKDPSSRKPAWRWPNELPIEGKPSDVTQAVAAYNQKLQESELPKMLFYATACLRRAGASRGNGQGAH